MGEKKLLGAEMGRKKITEAKMCKIKLLRPKWGRKKITRSQNW